jgi:hypothetical protein
LCRNLEVSLDAGESWKDLGGVTVEDIDGEWPIHED